MLFSKNFFMQEREESYVATFNTCKLKSLSPPCMVSQISIGQIP
jgi:hypothetical protein